MRSLILVITSSFFYKFLIKNLLTDYKNIKIIEIPNSYNHFLHNFIETPYKNLLKDTKTLKINEIPNSYNNFLHNFIETPF